MKEPNNKNSCLLWFHDFDKWTDKELVEGNFHYVSGAVIPFSEYRQNRKCKICNLTQIRKVKP